MDVYPVLKLFVLYSLSEHDVLLLFCRNPHAKTCSYSCCVHYSSCRLSNSGLLNLTVCFQIPRSIGDAYLKKPKFVVDPSFPRFHLPNPIHRPVLRDNPSIYTRELKHDDKFIVFALDGLWNT
ncbi:hypothetical protein CTI12_AA026110 [Artemisia annua]|uniref:PPM-type phosphatase domain-containing protein n=1 Tax=Artemisia annua TaxID=35608 RepID=A0A2U1QIB8_ARTAN|nr:hypothetical protein CTI12_AA026110 [Artemisia annua]